MIVSRQIVTAVCDICGVSEVMYDESMEAHHAEALKVSAPPIGWTALPGHRVRFACPAHTITVIVDGEIHKGGIS
jgi:hypothetical protein